MPAVILYFSFDLSLLVRMLLVSPFERIIFSSVSFLEPNKRIKNCFTLPTVPSNKFMLLL